ncbi:hypothetical protein GT037_005989, partial [Alternaria burnsii]
VRVGGAKTPSNITVKGKLTGPTPQFPRLAVTTLHMVASHFHGTDAIDGNTGTINAPRQRSKWNYNVLMTSPKMIGKKQQANCFG